MSVVIGGQYGSEGKGKVTHWIAAETGASAVVRVGGPNSGHTVVNLGGRRAVLRQLPVAALLPGVQLCLPAGSYIDPEVLISEIRRFNVDPSRLAIDPNAVLINDRDKLAEASLRQEIGSTATGVGHALLRRVARDGATVGPLSDDRLKPYVQPTTPLLRRVLDSSGHVVIEGTQGFGLSLLHGGFGRFATSRDTTAAGFTSEAGLSPLDVTSVVMVIRTFPIRVAGPSGPLPLETDWATVANFAESPGLIERTTVTNKIRRVARFDPDVVKRAIAANRPTTLVLNHVDYLGDLTTSRGLAGARSAADRIEESIGQTVDLFGTGPDRLLDRARWHDARPIDLMPQTSA